VTAFDFDKLWESTPSAVLTPEDEAELERITAETERSEAECPNRQRHVPHLLGDDGCEHCGFYGK
jgi:hypothetical protein